MSISLSLVLNPKSEPVPRVSQWQDHEPNGVVDVDGMVIQAGRPCDLANLGKALLDAAEKLAAAQVNWAARHCTKCSRPLDADDPSNTGLGHHVDCTIDGAPGWTARMTVTDLPTEAARREQAKAQHPSTLSKQCPPHAALLHRMASMITTEDLPPAHLNINGRDIVVDLTGTELVENAVRRWAAALELLVVEVPVDGPAGVAATRWDASGWDGTGCWWHVVGDLPVAAVTA